MPLDAPALRVEDRARLLRADAHLKAEFSFRIRFRVLSDAHFIVIFFGKSVFFSIAEWSLPDPSSED